MAKLNPIDLDVSARMTRDIDFARAWVEQTDEHIKKLEDALIVIIETGDRGSALTAARALGWDDAKVHLARIVFRGG